MAKKSSEEWLDKRFDYRQIKSIPKEYREQITSDHPMVPQKDIPSVNPPKKKVSAKPQKAYREPTKGLHFRLPMGIVRALQSYLKYRRMIKPTTMKVILMPYINQCLKDIETELQSPKAKEVIAALKTIEKYKKDRKG